MVATMALLQMPNAFVDRPSSPASLLTPFEVRAMRHSGRQMFGCVINLALMCLGVIAFFPIAVIFAAIALYFGQKWIRICRLAESGTVRKVECPNCGTTVTYWIGAFDCPRCRHRLMQRGDRIYDVSP
jgi:hypothetical protein